jgi:SIR2-like domain
MNDIEKPHKDLLAEALRILGNQYDANADFNASFDGEEPLTLTSPRRDVDAYQYERSKVLFWLDREAYDDERTAWENDTHQARHKEVIELIRAQASEAPFQDLLAAVERGRIVPFVGAGMSKPMGMPLWGEALKELLSRLPGADAAGISALIDAGQYVTAAQALVEDDAVQTSNFISTKYRVQKIKLGGPMKLLPHIAKGCVITTNFDDAIEQTYGVVGIAFHAYMHGTQEHNFFTRLVRGDRCLLKLHGDAENAATHILTKAQYADGYGNPFDFHKPLPKALRQVFVSQSLLFVGCSLEQDWTLELFEQAKRADEYVIPNHYAILPSPEDAQAKQRKATRLLKLNIQPMWYPLGQHEFLERYLQLIVDVAEKRISYNG